MANDDVIEQRYMDVMARMKSGLPWGVFAEEVIHVMFDMHEALRASRARVAEIRKLAEEYKADPINSLDRPYSWIKLDLLLRAALSAEDGREKETPNDPS